MCRDESTAIKGCTVMIMKVQSWRYDVLYKPTRKGEVQLKPPNRRLGEAGTRASGIADWGE